MTTNPSRQARLVARLREAGGERVTVNMPADALRIVDAIAKEVGVTRTDAILAVIRKAAEHNPHIAKLVSQ